MRPPTPGGWRAPPARDPLLHHTLHVTHGPGGGECPFSPRKMGRNGAWPEVGGAGLGWVALPGPSSFSISA